MVVGGWVGGVAALNKHHVYVSLRSKHDYHTIVPCILPQNALPLALHTASAISNSSKLGFP